MAIAECSDSAVFTFSILVARVLLGVFASVLTREAGLWFPFSYSLSLALVPWCGDFELGNVPASSIFMGFRKIGALNIAVFDGLRHSFLLWLSQDKCI